MFDTMIEGEVRLTQTKSKKTLTDTDIETRQRRTGPDGGAHGTDVDTDVHAATDSDAAPTPDSGIKAHTDRDS